MTTREYNKTKCLDSYSFAEIGRGLTSLKISSDLLKGYTFLLLFVSSTIPMISGDFSTQWHAITVGMGREHERKKNILSYNFFFDGSLS